MTSVKPGKDQPTAPTYQAGGGSQQNPVKHQEPPPAQSQKGQIVQYFRSQGKQPDDVVWSIGGLNLTLKDLEGG